MSTPITGHTSWYALVADPIAHVKAPTVFNTYFDAHDLDAKVVPIHVAAEGLPAVVTGLRSMQNLLGIGVTIPHKETIAALVDELTPEAKLCGATNVIRRNPDGTLLGAQFDGPGFAVGLGKHGVDVAGKKVLLAGAGGSARAIAFEMARRGASALTITNRTKEKAAALANEVQAAFPLTVCSAGGPEVVGHDVVVNATKLGMKPDDALPFDVTGLTANHVVADIVMEPAQTALLAAGAAAGCRVVPGKAMLDGQVEVTVEFLGLAGGSAA